MRPNRLDQVTKLLREQLHDIEREERELRRAKDRVLKALGLFVKETPQGHLSGPKRGGGPLGPIRKDSHIIVRDAIKANFAPGFQFTRNQAAGLVAPEVLRVGQANGGIDSLVKQGWLTKAGYNAYTYGNNGGNGND